MKKILSITTAIIFSMLQSSSASVIPQNTVSLTKQQNDPMVTLLEINKLQQINIGYKLKFIEQAPEQLPIINAFLNLKKNNSSNKEAENQTDINEIFKKFMKTLGKDLPICNYLKFICNEQKEIDRSALEILTEQSYTEQNQFFETILKSINDKQNIGGSIGTVVDYFSKDLNIIKFSQAISSSQQNKIYNKLYQQYVESYLLLVKQQKQYEEIKQNLQSVEKLNKQKEDKLGNQARTISDLEKKIELISKQANQDSVKSSTETVQKPIIIEINSEKVDRSTQHEFCTYLQTADDQNEIIGQLNHKISTYIAYCEYIKSDNQKQIDKLQQECEDHKSKLEEKERENQLIKQQYEESKTRQSECESEIGEQKKKITNQAKELTILAATNEELKKTKSEINKELETKKLELQEETKKAQQIKNQMTNITRQLEQKTKEIKALNDKYDEFTANSSKNIVQQMEIGKQISIERNKLQETVEQQKKQLKENEQKNKSLQEQINQLQITQKETKLEYEKTIIELKQQIENQQTKLEENEYTNNLRSTENAKLQQTIINLQTEHKQQIQNQANHIMELRAKLKQMTSEHQANEYKQVDNRNMETTQKNSNTQFHQQQMNEEIQQLKQNPENLTQTSQSQENTKDGIIYQLPTSHKQVVEVIKAIENMAKKKLWEESAKRCIGATTHEALKTALQQLMLEIVADPNIKFGNGRYIETLNQKLKITKNFTKSDESNQQNHAHTGVEVNQEWVNIIGQIQELKIKSVKLQIEEYTKLEGIENQNYQIMQILYVILDHFQIKYFTESEGAKQLREYLNQWQIK